MSISRIIIFTFLSLILFSCSEPTAYRDEIYQKPEINPDPAAPSLSPEASMKTMYLPGGYRLELVASEPMIKEPIAIAWGPDGKLYVAEMRTYMQDIDGTNENEPWSRVSMLEDTDGDGKMDKSTIFVDSLVLPRNILPLDDRVIISETYSNNFWSYRDTDGDGKADEKILLFADSTIYKGNLEHQSANLTWNIDNRMYLSRNAFAYRWNKGQMIRDTLLDAPEGQYGLTQDETGRMYYSKAGGEVVALGFQQHPIYGSLDLEGQYEEGFEEPWPIIGTPDVQGGTRRLKPDNTLNKFTGVSGQEIFLGNKLPAYGDLFVPEPVGRLIRRAKVTNIDGKRVLSNPYEQTEFMASTDPNFRPVMVKTGPDGCLYVVDMYRGIIQEGNWVKVGSYLRPEVKRRNLDKNVSKGRIYRIVHEQMKPDQPTPLLDKSAEELLEFLGHPNAWYRMTAQKLLLVKEERSSIPDLKKIVLDNESLFSSWFSPKKDLAIQRLHALWTLDGFDAIDPPFLTQVLKDKDDRVRSAAIRISEKHLGQGNESIFAAISQMTDDPSKDALIQLAQSLKTYPDTTAARKFIAQLVQSHPDNELLVASATIVPSDVEALKKKFALHHKSTQRMVYRGYEIYKGLCATCHGKQAEGLKDLGPPLATSPRMMDDNVTTPIKILLDGLYGPIDGKDYGIMAPMKSNDDKWIADVLTYVRENYADAGRIRDRDVKQVREKYQDRDQYWTLTELKQAADD